jgi:hypothetical protein
MMGAALWTVCNAGGCHTVIIEKKMHGAHPQFEGLRAEDLFDY